MSHLFGPVDLCNSQVKTDEMQDLLSQNLKPKLFPDILESALDPLCMEIDRWKPIDTLQIGIHGAHRTTCWQADPDADRRATFRQSLSVLKRCETRRGPRDKG